MGKRSYPGIKRTDAATKRAAERTTDAARLGRRGPKRHVSRPVFLDPNRVRLRQ
jgi:hypothetical protein